MPIATPRSALVTGANGGIGQALCKVFHERGWHVIGTDLQPAAAKFCDSYVSADLARLSTDISYRADVLKKLRTAVPDQNTLGALVNNAALQIVAPIEKISAQDWAATHNVNVTAPFLLVQGLLAELEAAAGAVVNIASIHATQTKPEFTAYAASKAALVGLTRALAVELGGRVRVNAVCPAAVSTPMLAAGFVKDPQGLDRLASYHPSGTVGTPDEVAAFVVMLASDASKYITGAILNLDGGISSRLFDPA